MLAGGDNLLVFVEQVVSTRALQRSLNWFALKINQNFLSSFFGSGIRKEIIRIIGMATAIVI
jgi:hypothetical protein